MKEVFKSVIKYLMNFELISSSNHTQTDLNIYTKKKSSPIITEKNFHEPHYHDHETFGLHVQLLRPNKRLADHLHKNIISSYPYIQ